MASRSTRAPGRAPTRRHSRNLPKPASPTLAAVRARRSLGNSRHGPAGPIYPGTCRNGLPPNRPARSVRLRARSGEIRFHDDIQGVQCQDVSAAVGDFVLLRADGVPAYQLAVVVDDAWQGINHVVRGADLLVSTPAQILLQQALGLPRPTYGHVPLALDAAGRKLSKSLASAPVDPENPLPALRRAWAWLGQPPAPATASVTMFWEYAIRHWRIERVPAIASACINAGPSASIGN